MAFSDFFKKGGKNSANVAKIGKTAQERKDISIKILKSQGVPFTLHLPLPLGVRQCPRARLRLRRA